MPQTGLPESPLVAIVRRLREPTLPVLTVAHRGDSQNAPENTLAAFALAVEHGAELVEFDVHETADGDVVVLHDETVDRTTDGRGEVHRLPTAAVRELSAGAWFGARWKDERVPLLDEALDLCRAGRVAPMVEIKVKWRRRLPIGRKVGEALRRHGLSDKAVVIVRGFDRVPEVKAAAPETPVVTLTFTKRQARTAMRSEGVSGVDCYWKSLSSGLVAELRQGGFFMTPWTVNRARDIERLILIGSESVVTDAPVLSRDRIERFELERTLEHMERVARGEPPPLDLEQDDDAPGPTPDELAADPDAPS